MNNIYEFGKDHENQESKTNLTTTTSSSMLETLEFETLEVDSIPLCLDCLIDFEKGSFVCFKCKLNLCTHHLIKHLEKHTGDKSHERSILKLKTG